MKYPMTFLKLIISGAIFCLSISAQSFTNSTSTKLSIFGIWLSTNADCSSPVEVINSATSTEYNMHANPTFGSKAIAAGTYKCMIIKMLDTVKFTPSATDAPSCTIGTEYTIDTCIPANTVNTSRNALTGATITCTNSPDTVYIYISKNAHCADSLSAGCNYPNAFLPPTQVADALNGIKLTSDMVLTADATGTFVFNADGKVDGSGGACNIEPPVISVR